MEYTESFRIVARLLRDEACRSEVPPDRAFKNKSLAEFFETLAADSRTKSADRRFD
jgi:hypothetical protein